MLQEAELNFLRDVFKKCHIHTSVMSRADAMAQISSSDFRENFGGLPLYRRFLHGELNTLAHGTVYKQRDALGLCFLFFLLPPEDASLLVVGPYHTDTPSRSWLLELGEKNGISPKRQRHFEEYMMSIPVLTADSPLLLMLDRFCELIWNSPSFAIVDINETDSVPPSPISESLQDDDFDDILMSVKAMETRYALENELIRAVSLGQLHVEGQLLSAFSEHGFERRVPDELRNAKNYGIIMNTLLRKAAESGGVHPVYIDRVSSEFALKIEQLPSLSENGALMREMFRSYCRLVRKHTIRHLSPTVQKTVLLIDSDLSANLSPRRLAEQQSISLGYLSTIFKRETGKTISEYIREKRMQHAVHLLSTTNLQVQTVALHCGIVDVQYFSKIFKQQIGKTPKEYRESLKSAPLA